MPARVVITINASLSIVGKEETLTLKRQAANPHDIQTFTLSQDEVERCLEAAGQWVDTEIEAKRAELEEANGSG